MLGYTDDYRPASPLGAAAGPAPARDNLILQDLEAIRPTVDIVVLQLHWGVEFAMYPWLTHRTRARRYAEAGADLVLCHHAHVPMGVEVWKRSLIAYGLGTLLFPASRHLAGGHPWSHRSVVFKVGFGQGGISHAEMIPVEVRADFSVAPSTGARRAQMLGALGKASKGLQDSEKLAAGARGTPSPENARMVSRRSTTGRDWAWGPPKRAGGPPHGTSAATRDRVGSSSNVLHRSRCRLLLKQVAACTDAPEGGKLRTLAGPGVTRPSSHREFCRRFQDFAGSFRQGALAPPPYGRGLLSGAMQELPLGRGRVRVLNALAEVPSHTLGNVGKHARTEVPEGDIKACGYSMMARP